MQGISLCIPILEELLLKLTAGDATRMAALANEMATRSPDVGGCDPTTPTKDAAPLAAPEFPLRENHHSD